MEWHFRARCDAQGGRPGPDRVINKVLPSPDVQEKVSKLGMEMRGSTPEAMTERMKSDIAKWAAVIEKAGIPKHD